MKYRDQSACSTCVFRAGAEFRGVCSAAGAALADEACAPRRGTKVPQARALHHKGGTEKDYEVFLSSLEAYLKEMKEPLAALAAASDQTVAAKL